MMTNKRTFYSCQAASLVGMSTRAIIGILLFFMLGLSIVSAKSTSHTLIEHEQHADGSHHAPEKNHDQVDMGSPDGGETDHTHKHDPTDHTHDIPLRLLLTVNVLPLALLWESRVAAVLYPIPVFRLERPPKLASLG
jgi:hypothetical protein